MCVVIYIIDAGQHLARYYRDNLDIQMVVMFAQLERAVERKKECLLRELG